MTKRDLFWRLFQSSGHIGAYLLYSDCGDAESQDAKEEAEPGSTGEGRPGGGSGAGGVAVPGRA